MFSPTLIGIWLLMSVAFAIPACYILVQSKVPHMMLLAFMAYSLGSYIAVERVLSHPMPLSWEVAPANKYQVIGYTIKEDMIYVLFDGGGVPRYYVLPIKDGENDPGRMMAERLPGMMAKANKYAQGAVMYEPALNGSMGMLTLDLPKAPPPK